MRAMSAWRCTYAALTALTALAAHATYPEKPLRFVVGLAPGGGVDFTARTLAARLAISMGQAVVVDNRAGAGGSIAAGIVARSAADGYTLLLGSRSAGEMEFITGALTGAGATVGGGGVAAENVGQEEVVVAGAAGFGQ